MGVVYSRKNGAEGIRMLGGLRWGGGDHFNDNSARN